MALAPIRARRIFPATGPYSNLAFRFNFSDFHVTHRFFVTFFTEESNVSLVLPVSPRPPNLAKEVQHGYQP